MTADARSCRQRAAALRDRAHSVSEPALHGHWQQAALEWEWLAYELERAGQAEDSTSWSV